MKRWMDVKLWYLKMLVPKEFILPPNLNHNIEPENVFMTISMTLTQLQVISPFRLFPFLRLNFHLLFDLLLLRHLASIIMGQMPGFLSGLWICHLSLIPCKWIMFVAGWSQVDRVSLVEQKKRGFLLKGGVKILQKSNNVIIYLLINNKWCDTAEHECFSINN